MNNLWQTLGKVKGGKDVSLSDGFGSNPFKGSLHLSPVSLFMRFSSVKPFHNLNINLLGKVRLSYLITTATDILLKLKLNLLLQRTALFQIWN